MAAPTTTTTPTVAAATNVTAPSVAPATGTGAVKLTHAQLRDQLKAAERAADAKALAALTTTTNVVLPAGTGVGSGAAAAVTVTAAPAAAAVPPAAAEFANNTHIKYFESHINLLPEAYLSLDHSRMHVVYFGLSALDMLSHLDKFKTDAKRRELMINWIYNLQIQPTYGGADGKVADYRRCGFRGSTIMGQPFDPKHDQKKGWNSEYDESNMAMTYTALTSLLILGDDLSRVNRRAVIGALQHLQQPDGSFTPTLNGGERDMRFVYCACAISHLLNDWSGFDLERTIAFIIASQSYDGAFGLSPHLEGHGGSTYTAVASLSLLNALDRLSSPARSSLIKWALSNQGEGGYRGRPNKPEDCCYSFWIAAVLQIMGVSQFTAPNGNRAFNMRCQSKYGGFSKYPNHYPDVLHAHYGLAGLSLIGADNLKPIDVSIGLTFQTLSQHPALFTKPAATATAATATATA